MSFAFNGNMEVKRPYNTGHGSFTDGLWFRIKPRKLEYQSTQGRGGSIAIGKSDAPTFVFLAPENISEMANHSWTAYESVQSRLAEKVRSVAKLSSEVIALKNSFNNATIKGAWEAIKSRNPNTIMQKTLAGVKGSTVPKMKIDTPLVYEGSERRTWILNFNLIFETDAKKDVVDPVQDLMKYSSPAIGSGDINIELPYIFSLTTYPNSYIIAPYTALTAVQPTWKAPYSKGYPTSADLQLTFQDLSPLFRKTIETGSVINVIDKSAPKTQPRITPPH